MLKRILIFSIIFVAFHSVTFGSITYSVVPFLKQIEEIPPEKYSEDYNLKVNELLVQKAQKIRVVTYNVLFDLFDNQLKDSSYSWAERLPKILRSIENMQPDILCVQETYPSQLEDLGKALGASFLYYVGDESSGELNAVFYNKERFELNSSHVESASLAMPLSPKDDKIVATIPGLLPPELEPGRKLTLVHLRDKLTGKKMAVINTHLTYFRVNSREAQAHFIADLARELHALDNTVIFTGDLNTLPNRPDKPDSRFYDGDSICRVFQAVLKDTKDVAWLGHVGPLVSYVEGFLQRGSRPILDTENPGFILDHIFVSPAVEVIVNAIEPSLVDDSFPSDHLPVIADILLP